MEQYVYVLRTSRADGTSYGGFQWPTSGMVECPDWKDDDNCGNGLHGALNGEGDGSLFYWDVDALWQVLRVLKKDVRELDGKVKFPRCEVIYNGSRLEATQMIAKLCPDARVIIGGTATAGNWGTATAGYNGTATAGNWGTATAGYNGTATAGDNGTATAGYNGTATAGNRGTATAGDNGTATAGNWGTATAGDNGTATAGNWGILQIKYCDGTNPRYRIATAYVGENGIKPNTPYELDENHNFVEADAGDK